LTTPAGFDELMGDLDVPMLIVTVAVAGRRDGCLVGFETQVSIDPPRLLVCLSQENRTYRSAQEAEHLAVHFVPADRQDLAELFGGETGDDTDKFEQCEWRDGPAGQPLLEGCEDWVVGRVVERFDFGDHCGFVLDPVAAGHGEQREHLSLRRAAEVDPGHEA
jgi:flavin reductase (DIM6/NTAB) family NADH-FMN oxidoreductase RutF